MSVSIKTLRLSLEVLEVKVEFYFTTWKQNAMGLHALHTQVGENCLVQCVPSELAELNKQWGICS